MRLSAPQTIHAVDTLSTKPVSDPFKKWYDSLLSYQRRNYGYLRRFLDGETTFNSPGFPIGKRFLGMIEKTNLVVDRIIENGATRNIKPTFALIYTPHISMPTQYSWLDGTASDIYMPMGDIYIGNLLHWFALHGIDTSDRVFSLVKSITRPDLYEGALRGNHSGFRIVTQDASLRKLLDNKGPIQIINRINNGTINPLIP
jgi:hypothetical protein